MDINVEYLFTDCTEGISRALRLRKTWPGLCWVTRTGRRRGTSCYCRRCSSRRKQIGCKHGWLSRRSGSTDRASSCDNRSLITAGRTQTKEKWPTCGGISKKYLEDNNFWHDQKAVISTSEISVAVLVCKDSTTLSSSAQQLKYQECRSRAGGSFPPGFTLQVSKATALIRHTPWISNKHTHTLIECSSYIRNKLALFVCLCSAVCLKERRHKTWIK